MRKIESFRFKKFSLEHSQSAQKIGTDSVLLATWIEHHNPRRILDIGSGCGLISFILAQRFPNSEIVGIEIDKESHDESLINLNSFPLATKLSFINADFLEYDFENLEFDLIISNPPFFKDAFLSGSASRNKARHEFSLPHLQLMEKCTSILNKNGKLALVLPTEESELLQSNAKMFCNRLTKLKNKPSAKIKRHLSEWSFFSDSSSEDEFILRNENGDYSDSYKSLTKDYYLEF
tara:strand:- start:109852 stop:110556 length:705 start_codon:yes stop_codon:yes gene_type:complete